MLVSELKALCAYARGKSILFHSKVGLINGYTLETHPYTPTFNGQRMQTRFHYYIVGPDGRTCVENTSLATFCSIASRWMNTHPLPKETK